MIVIFQKVKKAKIIEDNTNAGEISDGVLLYVGIDKHDSKKNVEEMASKIINSKIIPDKNGRMTESISSKTQEIMLISQFTLCAEINKNKPSFQNAKNPSEAKELYINLVNLIKENKGKVVSGNFGKYLVIESENDGPVNFILTS